MSFFRLAIVIVLGIPVLVLFGIFVYYIMYKQHINKVLSEENPSGKQMPSMSRFIQLMLIVGIIMILMSLLSQIGTLNSTVNYLSGQVADLDNRLNSMNYSMEDQIEELLKKQNSLVNTVTLEYGELNDAYETEITIHVLPKSVPKDSSLAIRIGTQKITLEPDAEGWYRGDWSQNIFAENIPDSITYFQETGEMQYTETLELPELSTLRESCLPGLSADISWSSEESTPSEMHIAGTIEYCDSASQQNASYFMESAQLVVLTDGKILSKDSIFDMAKEENGSFQVVNDGDYPQQRICEVPFDLTWNINGDNKTNEVLIYVDAEDSRGLIHRYVLYRYSGVTGGEYEAPKYGAIIMDHNGTVLWGSDKSL